ncbi:MAG: DMT family transporter [Pseudomonadota bacterium]
MPEGLIATIVFSLLSAASFGFTAHLQAKGLDRSSPQVAARLNLATIFGLSMLAAPFYLDPAMFWTKGAWIFAAVGVLFPFLTMQLQIASIPRVGATLTIALGNFVPFFAVVPAVFLLGETLGLQGFAGLLVMTAGLFAATMRWGGLARGFPLWVVALPLGAAALRGFGMPLIKFGQETAPDPMFGLLVMSCVSTLLIYGLGALKGTLRHPQGNAGWLVAAGASQWCGLVFMAFALDSGDVVIATPIIAIAPLCGLLYGAYIFRSETLGRRHVLTASLVVVGGILLVTR